MAGMGCWLGVEAGTGTMLSLLGLGGGSARGRMTVFELVMTAEMFVLGLDFVELISENLMCLWVALVETAFNRTYGIS